MPILLVATAYREPLAIKVIRKKGILIFHYIEGNHMTKINEKLEFRTSNRTKKNSNDWKLELFALIGFCISGVIFILSGIQNGDYLTIIGSSVWIFSCVIWMIPYRKYFDNCQVPHDS